VGASSSFWRDSRVGKTRIDFDAVAPLVWPFAAIKRSPASTSGMTMVPSISPSPLASTVSTGVESVDSKKMSTNSPASNPLPVIDASVPGAVAVGSAVLVAVGSTVGVSVAIADSVASGVSDASGVAEPVALSVGVGVIVPVGDADGSTVAVAVVDGVGVEAYSAVVTLCSALAA
jgi:hypothetical protein